MARYILKRIIQLIPVVIGVTLMVYFILDLAPGDITFALGGDQLSQEDLLALRHELGMDQPFIVRYLKYMGGLVRGDLGTSLISGRSVTETFFMRLPTTLRIALSATLFSVVFSIPLGIYSAVKKGSIQDNLATVFSILGMSMPNFWLGLLLVITFSLKLGWFPSSGYSGAASLVLPAVTVGTGLMANLTRMTRSSMLDVLNQDYLRTVRAKGVSEKKVIRKHAFKNALIPIITVIGTQLGVSLGGSILTESVFAIPGVGRLMIDSINQRDTPQVLGCVVLTTILISVIMLLVDLLYALVDPRIKAQYARGGKKS